VSNQTVQLPHDVCVTSLSARDPQPVNRRESSASHPPVAAGGVEHQLPTCCETPPHLHGSTHPKKKRRREPWRHLLCPSRPSAASRTPPPPPVALPCPPPPSEGSPDSQPGRVAGVAGARARSPNKVTSLSDVVGWGAEGQSGSSLCFTLCSCWCRRADDNESKAVLDAFFLGKAFAEALTERVESVVGEVFSVVGQWQAEQQKQVQDFQVLHDTILAPDYALSSVCNNNLQVFSVLEYQNL
jgi:hypothetical protein